MRTRLPALVAASCLAAGCLVNVERVEDPAPAFAEARRQAGLAAGRQGQASRLHVLAYTASDAEFTRVNLPLWLARKLDPEELELDGAAGKLRLQDLRKAAPGFLLESQDEDGERVLVWVD